MENNNANVRSGFSLSAPVRLDTSVLIGEIGLWAAVALTLITGYDYLVIGLQHMREDKRKLQLSTRHQVAERRGITRTAYENFWTAGWSGWQDDPLGRFDPRTHTAWPDRFHHRMRITASISIRPAWVSWPNIAVGATEVMVTSVDRWALMHENRGAYRRRHLTAYVAGRPTLSRDLRAIP